jgi:outer membrane protein OmpA-like peptidoglycan-associated protein
LSAVSINAVILCAALTSASGLGAAGKTDMELERLAASIQMLDEDPALADLSGLERLKAKQSIEVLRNARSRERESALYLAERWVEAAQLAAQAELLREQSQQLDRERDQIMLEASRRDAQRARLEADRLRLQRLAQEEEAQRMAEHAEGERLINEQSAAATAAQARKLAEAQAREVQLARQEAELAAAVAADSMAATAVPPTMREIDGKSVYTLAGSAFASGSSRLTAAAQASLQRLAAILRANPSAIRIEGHTDDQGAEAANLQLSQQRADSVARALINGGVSESRIKASGKGETVPLADNASPEGRARNRRVEIIE